MGGSRRDVVEYMAGGGGNGTPRAGHGVARLPVHQAPLAGVIRLVQFVLGVVLGIGPLHVQKSRYQQER